METLIQVNNIAKKMLSIVLISPQNFLLEILPGLCLGILSYLGSCFNFRDSLLFSNSSNHCLSQRVLTVKLTSGPRTSDTALVRLSHRNSCQLHQEEKPAERPSTELSTHRHGEASCPGKATLKWIQLSNRS